MWILLLAAAGAVIYWSICTVRERRNDAPPEPERPAEAAEDWRDALPPAARAVAEAADVCLEIMTARQLGDSGSLTVRFPRQLFAGDFPTVTCQFLDRGEGLYALVVRGEPARDRLTAEGVPEAVFTFSPVWSAEGGMVSLTAEIRGVPPVIEGRMARFQQREETLAALAAELAGRYPAFSVYNLAGDVLFLPRTGDLSSTDTKNPGKAVDKSEQSI